MRNLKSTVLLAAACMIMLSAGPALSQQKSGGGVVCWKDKSGKTVGCGDKVPPEYQDSANSTLNKRGVTVNQSDVAQTPEQQRSQQADAEKKKLDERKREDEKRRDRALLDSFTSEKEIDLKRARDIQQIEINISTQQSYVKNLTDRQNEARLKIEQYKKESKPAPPATQLELDRTTAELAKTEAQIAQKRKEIVDRNRDYDDMKKRFNELTGANPAAAAAKPAPAATPAAAGKK